jgi:hypothetical protein
VRLLQQDNFLAEIIIMLAVELVAITSELKIRVVLVVVVLVATLHQVNLLVHLTQLAQPTQAVGAVAVTQSSVAVQELLL